MLDMVFYFLIGLAIISVPCYAFYKAGISAGIQRGVRRQILRELMLCGVIEKAEPEQRHYHNYE
ncbi:MAG: hypothetical protein R3F02_12405 [Thiolinea sp.]